MISETEDFKAERDLKMWQEGIDAAPLFKYLIKLPDDECYLANEVEITPLMTVPDRIQAFKIVMNHVWTYDFLLPNRMVPHVEAVAFTYELVHLS